MDNGHWIYPNDFNINNWFGFVYRIIDTVTNREYIGKKQFFTKTSKAITGRKNRAWKTKESNWKKYTSSSDEINKLIKEFGKDRFQFFIESLHATKASLTYAEVEKLKLCNNFDEFIKRNGLEYMKWIDNIENLNLVNQLFVTGFSFDTFLTLILFF